MASAELTAALLELLQRDHGLFAQGRLAAAWAQVQRLIEDGVEVIPRSERERYPAALAALPDPPPLLFVAGGLDADCDARGVAVIGSRQAGPTALDAAARVARALAEAGRPVVSGLARGIDTAAHEAAIAANARTVAVIGTGIDVVYPPENRQLQNLIAEHGAVISQFAPGTGPSRTTFPVRNATMAALSAATVIVDATQTSGARIQARHALALGRPLILLEALLRQPWARELASNPAVRVISTPGEVVDALG